MKIGFTGTHSTGKTTIVEALRTERFFHSYFFDINVTRWVHSLGLPINEDTTDISQEVNMIKRVAHLATFDDIISDRTLIDVVSYSAAGKNISVNSQQYQLQLMLSNINRYDYIFRLPMSIASTDDGVRGIDPVYRAQIDDIQSDIISQLPVDIREKIHIIDGSVRERIEQVLHITGVNNESA
jgi:molybdopterin-guanine dinucleotide biosynthesis protein